MKMSELPTTGILDISFFIFLNYPGPILSEQLPWYYFMLSNTNVLTGLLLGIR